MAASAEYKARWYMAHREEVLASRKAYRAANSEKLAAYFKRYQAANAEKISARQKAYYAANFEKAAASAKSWHAANPEKVAAIRKRWYAANSEKKAEYGKRHRLANPAQYAARCAKHRAMKMEATPAWAVPDLIELIYEEAAIRGMEVDHIIPLLGRNVCGLHIHNNLQLLTRSQNASKGNRFLSEVTYG